MEVIGVRRDRLVNEKARVVLRALWKNFPYILLLILFAFFSIMSKHFGTLSNFTTILEQTGVLLVVGMGMTPVIIAGSIDLSVGSVVGLAGGIAALSIKSFGPAGIIIALISGCAVGLVSGTIFSRGKIPSFIVTLGMLTICRGLLLIITNATGVLIMNQGVRAFGIGSILGVPNIFLVFVAVFAFYYLIFNHTPYGRNIRAVGGGEEVARLSGVNVEAVKLGILVLSGFAASIGGVLSCIRMGASTPSLGTSFELDVIASVVLGGTPLTGGIGRLSGTIVGAFIMGILNNGLNVMGVEPYYQMVVKGTVVVIAVLLTIDRKRIGIVK
jgi:ribose transport system permease protein